MTHEEWLDCDSVGAMLLDLAKGDLAQPQRLLSLSYFFPGKRIARARLERKLYLFACACFRHNGYHLTDPLIHEAVEVTERFADQKASCEELLAAGSRHHRVSDLAQESGWYAAWYGSKAAAMDDTVDENTERKEQAKLLRDVLGNLFRPVSLHPSWLKWNGGLLVSMAQTMYNSRQFIDMPILADALEDAGCTNADILNHCRQPGEHVRGCWVIDLILGKE